MAIIENTAWPDYSESIVGQYIHKQRWIGQGAGTIYWHSIMNDSGVVFDSEQHVANQWSKDIKKALVEMGLLNG